MKPDRVHVPSLRFPEHVDPWVPSNGGDAFTQRRQRGEEGLPIYSVTLEGGMVPRDSLDREISSNADDEANLRANKNDMVYNMMRMWQGAVGLAPVDCMVSPAYVVLIPKQVTSPQFFKHWFKRSRSIYWLWAYSYGLTGDRLRLYYRDFVKVPMLLPSPSEQRKIADFLGAVDLRTELLRSQLNALKRYKRGLAQSLFSQRLRLKDDGGRDFPDWERAPLSEMVGRPSEQFNPGETSERPFVIELENIESGSGRIINGSALADQQSMKVAFKSGDILFGKLRPYLRKFWLADRPGVCSSEIWVLRPRNVQSSYLYQFVQTNIFIRVANQSSGSKMPRADWSVVGKMPVPRPHADEQRKIADFLGTVDDRLAGVTAKIEAMQAFKKALLQNMFI
ncbi:restriction endonuclease subunit S [Mesorhizobium sp. M0139]|uniref:restriction endonuclease subunit S n=1 Tax=Mesorhizobium sp. M0139 TaxID=2956892 RepID=UPI00333D8725